MNDPNQPATDAGRFVTSAVNAAVYGFFFGAGFLSVAAIIGHFFHVGICR